MSDSDNEILLRRNAKFLLAMNPNYFGNLGKLDYPKLPKPVLQKSQNKAFEELRCIGYDPQSEQLVAIVEIKKKSGYSGGPCTDGSQEHVRFYLDYGDGVWVDHGTAGFTAHDLPFREKLCYAAAIRIDPKRRSLCFGAPVLPRVRAILSWQIVPPPNMPDWLPVWGNRLERQIQIAPRTFTIGQLDLAEIFDLSNVGDAIFDKLHEALGTQPKSADHHLVDTLPDLAAIHQMEPNTAAMRQLTPLIAKMAQDPGALGLPDQLAALGMLDLEFAKLGDFFLKPQADSSYEELPCLGYDRERDMLHGIVHIKRPSGYSGGLCKKGSREFVAFYLDFGGGWEYQGTTSVIVHDIPGIGDDGLWYQAALKVNLDAHRQGKCIAGKAKIRAILSWNTPPAAPDPDFIPHWGDRRECWLEVKPFDFDPGDLQKVAVLEAIGSMPISRINGTGFANGANIGGTIPAAKESPFGGKIKISGIIAFAGNDNLEYRISYKEPGNPVFQVWATSFDASVTTISGGIPVQTDVTQIAVDGWFRYLPKAGGPGIDAVSVAENLLGVFRPTKEGPHEIKVEIRDAATHTILDHTEVKKFFVDNTPPDVTLNITSGTGDCGKFGVGDVIEGTFTMADAHAGAVSISVQPAAEARGGTLSIEKALPAVPVGPIMEPASGVTSVALSYPLTLAGTGVSDGRWKLVTSGMPPCGYTIHINARDRTIVNSSHIGWHAHHAEGFCLE